MDLEKIVKKEERKGFFSKLKNTIISTVLGCASIFSFGIVASEGCVGRHKLIYYPEKAVANYDGVLAVKDSLIVGFVGKPSVTEMESILDKALSGLDFVITEINRNAHIAYLRINDSNQFEEARQRLLRLKEKISGVSYNLLHNIPSTNPNDPLFNPGKGGWGYADLGITKQWLDNCAANMKIGIVDSSFNGAGNHPDLSEVIKDIECSQNLFGSLVASRNPAVALTHNGKELVAYDSNRFGKSSTFASLNGKVIRVDDSPGNFHSRRPAIATSNEFTAIVFEDGQSGNYDVMLRIFDDEGNRLGSTKVNSTTAGDQLNPQVANIGNSIVVAWTDCSEGDGDIAFRMFDQSGKPLTNEIKVSESSTANQQMPAICANGNGFVISWIDDRNGDNDVYAREFDINGNPATDEFPVKVAQGDQLNPKVGVVGDKKVFSWVDASGVNAKVVGTNEVEFNVFSNDSNTTTENASFAILNDNGEYKIFFVAQQLKEGDTNVVGKIYDLQGNLVKDQFCVNSNKTNFQGNPVIAGNDLEAHVVWVSVHTGTSKIFSKRFNVNGPVKEEKQSDDEPDFGKPNKSHGMEVAGIFAKINNGIGVAGSDSWLYLKECDGTAKDLFEKVSRAIVENRCSTVVVPMNISWVKNPSFDDPDDVAKITEYMKVWSNIARLACEYGVNIMAAAGNSELDSFWTTGISKELRESMPAFTIVGAYNSNGRPLLSGGNCDIFAPGSALTTTGVSANGEGFYGMVEGTSIAAAFGGLAAAMLRNACPWLTPRAVTQLLKVSGKDRSLSELITGKKVPRPDLQKAVELANENPPWSEIEETGIEGIIAEFEPVFTKNGEYILWAYSGSAFLKTPDGTVVDLPTQTGDEELGLFNVLYDKNANKIHMICSATNYNQPRRMKHYIFDCDTNAICEKQTIHSRGDHLVDPKTNTTYYWVELFEGATGFREGGPLVVFYGAYQTKYDGDFYDRQIGLFLFRYDSANKRWEFLEKVPFEFEFDRSGGMPSIDPSIAIGELGDIHIAWIDYPKKDGKEWIRLHYARKIENWEHRVLGEGGPSPRVFVKYENPWVITQKNGVTVKYSKSNGWREEPVFPNRPNASLVGFDNDGRMCFYENNTLFVDKGNGIEEKLIEGYGVRCLVVTEDGDFGNNRVFYLRQGSKFFRLIKPDY